MRDLVVVIHRGGRIVEEEAADAVPRSPAHPYTQELLAKLGLESVPEPSGSEPVTGCLVRCQCPHSMPRCEQVPGMLRDAEGRRARCCLSDATSTSAHQEERR